MASAPLRSAIPLRSTGPLWSTALPFGITLPAGVRASAVPGMALAVAAAPVLTALWTDAWSTAQGAQGPIVLASGLWLLTRPAPVPTPRPAEGAAWPAALLLAGLLALQALALRLGVLALAWTAMVGALAATMALIAGWRAVRPRWFALAYLLFAAPLPLRLVGPLVDRLTVWLSATAVAILQGMDVEAARSGLDLYVDQYELRMADACAGLNALTSLFAIGLFYVYVRHRQHWGRALVLCLLVPPVAVLANLARIVILLLITHCCGDAMAQGVLHKGAGMLTFALALATLFAADALIDGTLRHAGARR